MVISSVSSRNQQVGCCNFSSCQKLKTFLVACWPGDPNYCWDWNFFVALLLMEKSPAITSWYLDIFGYIWWISQYLQVFFTSQVVVWDLWTINSIHHVWRELGMRSAMICLPRNHRCQLQRSLEIWGAKDSIISIPDVKLMQTNMQAHVF